ncbi:MAG: MFS transporter [Chloroflexota bacterium]|nr:MFS transporter [Dehalococcoidia bacterium]MDW8253837.1 MFS transporter [Chloroflexota bacterium]
MSVSSVAGAAPGGPADVPVFRNPNFLALWTAQAVSQTVQNVTFFTLMVFVEERTRSTAHMSALVLSTVLPAVLFGVASGVLIDRWNKKGVLIATNALRAVAVLGYLFLEQQPVLFYALNFTFMTISQFFLPAEAAMIPRIVSRNRLISANGLFNITFNLSQVLGFIAIGPPLTKAFGTQGTLIGVSLAYIFCSLILIRLPSDRGERLGREGRFFHDLGREVLAGWRLLRGDLTISLAMVHLTVVTTLTLILATLAPGFISRELNLSPDDTYLVFGPAGLGILAGTALLTKISRRFRLLSIVNFGLLLFGVGMLLIAAVSAAERALSGGALRPGSEALTITLIIVGLTALAMGIALAFVNVTAQTILQERAPVDMRGRVFAVQLMFGSLASIIPLVFIGQLADQVGILLVLGLVGIAVLGIAWFSVRQTQKIRAAVRSAQAAASEAAASPPAPEMAAPQPSDAGAAILPDAAPHRPRPPSPNGATEYPAEGSRRSSG